MSISSPEASSSSSEERSGLWARGLRFEGGPAGAGGRIVIAIVVEWQMSCIVGYLLVMVVVVGKQ